MFRFKYSLRRGCCGVVAVVALLNCTGCADLSFPTTRNTLRHSTDGPFSFLFTPVALLVTIPADLTVAGITDSDREAWSAIGKMQSGVPSEMAMQEAHEEFHRVATDEFHRFSDNCGRSNFTGPERAILDRALNLSMISEPYEPTDEVRSGLDRVDELLDEHTTADNEQTVQRIREHLSCVRDRLPH